MKRCLCVVDAIDCPYYNRGCCELYDEGSNPIEECDDCFSMVGDDVSVDDLLITIED